MFVLTDYVLLLNTNFDTRTVFVIEPARPMIIVIAYSLFPLPHTACCVGAKHLVCYYGYANF